MSKMKDVNNIELISEEIDELLERHEITLSAMMRVLKEKEKRKLVELLNDELAEVIEYEEDGEYIWLVQNHTTGKMSTGFTKSEAIHNYNKGKVFDISEWEE